MQTRQEFADKMLEILEPLKPFYSKEKALLKLGDTSAHYPDHTAWVEGFARPLWAIAPFLGGGSRNAEWEEIYRRGLAAGTDPQSEEYWGDCRPYDQMLVEMASMAFTILLAKEPILDKMTEQERQNLYRWLSQINTNPCYDCNWRFFHILVNVALKQAGQEYDQSGMEAGLQFIESCYVGDGWYLDGPDGYADYYVPWAMHFYGIVYAMFMQDTDPERCSRFLERAMQFGKEFVYWFSPDGSAVPYGRSLTYRFAQAAFYSACVMAEIEPLPLGVMKGIIVRNLEYWLRQPVFDHAGVLTIGYCYPNLQMAESYNAPGSPYWCMKLFACLARPENDPFWQAEPLPLPPLEPQKYLPHARRIIQRMPDGNVVMLPAGNLLYHIHTHTEEKYSKFAYSSKYGFSVMRSAVNFAEAAPDSVLSFEVDGHIFVRNHVEQWSGSETSMKSVWSPFLGIRVQTEVIPESWGHRRIHVVESDYDCVAYDAGFALPLDAKETGWVERIQGTGEEMLLPVDPNTNLIRSKTKIPAVKYAIHKGKNVLETAFRYD